MMTTAGDNQDKVRARGHEAVRDLLAIMAEQRRRATTLLEVIMAERQAVLSHNIQALGEINARKVAVLENFNKLDHLCKQKMAAVADCIGVHAGPETTVRQLIDGLEKPLAIELDKARSLLKNTLLEVREGNQANQKLLNQCLELVNQSAILLEQLINPPAVYSKDGNSRAGLQEGVLVSNVA